MPADRADPGNQGPQCVQAAAPALAHGGLSLVQPRARQLPVVVPSTGAVGSTAPAAAFVGAFLGCLATLHFCDAGFVPAIASALATILLCGPVLITRTTSLFPGELFTAIYGGTFAGMTQVATLGTDATGASIVSAGALFILLSVVTGLAFCIVVELDTRSGHRLAGGYGGRSGAIATVASFLFVEAALRFGADGEGFRAAHMQLPDLDPRSLAITFAASIIGMVATMVVLRRRSIASAQQAERIFIAAAIALLGLMILHLSDAGDAHGLDAFYAGCFLGMSSRERLKGWINPLLGAILLTAMLSLVKMLLPGIGGELGFAAFVTLALIVALRQLVTWQMMSWRSMIWLTTDRSPGGGNIRMAPSVSAGSFAPVRPVRNAINVAGSAIGLLMIGWMALPGQVASEQPDLYSTVQVTEQPEQPHAQIAMAGTNADAPDVALSLDLPAGAAEAVNTAGGPAREATATAAAVTGSVADARAELGHSDRTAGAALAPARSDRHESPLDDAAGSQQALFADFIRWRAAHSGAPAQAQPQPLRRSRHPAVQMVRLTPPASVRALPRAPVRVPAIRHQPGQSAP
jgi:hypothetical protein